MLEFVTSACASLLTKNIDVLLLSAMTERSFEEGARNKSFRQSIESMEHAGLTGGIGAQIRLGLNGQLAQIIQGKQAQSRVPDILFNNPEGLHGCIESKLLYDASYTKHYLCVVQDRLKLVQYRHLHPSTQTFQVVFFVQLPHFEYPHGYWYGAHKVYPSRSAYMNKQGIKNQFDFLMSQIPAPPTWPKDNGPSLFSLEQSEFAQNGFLNRWLEQVFRPISNWRFDPKVHLKQAAAGVCVWNVSNDSID